MRAVPRTFAIAMWALIWTASVAHAQVGDGAYGRLDGDLALSIAGGGALVLGERGGPDPTGSATLELRARVLDSAGVVVAPEWRPEGTSRLVLAIDLRPVFLARFLLNGESGRAWVDLMIDSIGLDLGAALVLGREGDVGAGVAVGLGLDLPLYEPSPGDPLVALRVAWRWVGALPADAVGVDGGASDSALFLAVVVRGLVDAGIASREAPRYRVR